MTKRSDNPAYPAAFVRAAQNDTAVLSSLLSWLDHERNKVIEALVSCNDPQEIAHLQGAARRIKHIRGALGDMARSRS